MPRNYALLLHDAVRDHMVSLDARGRERLREKLEFLQAGLWDTGVRVKKLKGSGRAVFEARLSRGDRILFTLGEPPKDEPPAGAANGGGVTRIYVWAVVQHDDVTAAAERRIVPANAPFLDFEPALVEELPEFVADDLGGDYFSPALDQPVVGDAAVDAGPQRWLVVDDQEWRRLLAAHDGDHLELYLFLTREQARLLHSEPPLLLSGTAGSGKTTIAVYFLLRHRVRRLTPAPDAATAPADPGARAVSADPGARGIPARGPAHTPANDPAYAPAYAPAYGTPGSAAPGGSYAPAAFPRAGSGGSTAGRATAGSSGAEGSTARSAAQGRSSRPVARGVGFPDAGVGPAGAERALFLTCSAHLKRFSERIYRGLVKATELEHTPEAVRFATLGELLGEILGHAGRPEWQAPPAGLAEFGAILRNHPGAARYDTELVWEEIRSIIKGAKPPVSRRRFAELAARFVAAQAAARDRAELAEYVVRLANLEAGARLDGVRVRKTAFGSLEEFAVSLRDGLALRRGEQLFLLDAAVRFLDKQSARLDQPLLTLREYEGLGHKRAPNFPFDRRDIHRIAEYYQKRLDAEARYDEIDQTRAVLQYLERHGDQFRYDLVVCDEVQDFTDMQLALLFRLADDPRRTVLTGDPKQIINPSGFRWEEVRARYYERGLPVPPVINLSINFRSVGNIVSLANEVLLLKRSLIGVASGEIAERWTFRGRPPLLVDGLAEAGLLEAIRRGGAGQVVLVRTEAERDRVRSALRTELVFTIGEAKGLEFDAVLLWRFPTALGSAAIWRRIASGRVQGAADAPHIRHELNLLYVAVTRARNTLLIWDGEQASPVWGIDGLAGQVYRSADAADIDNLWQRVSTPAEWRAQGDYFMERERFAAAEECYRNAQAATEEELARAHRLEREGELQAAAAVFIRLGRLPRAAEGLERAGAFADAARMWRRAGNEMRAMACEAKQAEAGGDYAAAAARWQQLGVEEGVLRNWQRSGDFGNLARFYLDRKEPSEAARYLQRIGDHAQAAEQFRRAGMLTSASAEYELAGDHERAAVLYRRLGDNDGLLRSLVSAGMFHDAGLLHEKRGDLEKAADCFLRHAASSPAARQELERELQRIAVRHTGMRAAIRMAAVGQPARAAPIYREHGHPERAAELFSAAGEHASAASCLDACGRYREAAREVLRRPDASPFAAADYLLKYLTPGGHPEPGRVGELTRAAGRLFRGAEYKLALAHYLAVGAARGDVYMEGVTAACGRLELHAMAIEYCLDSSRSAEASAYLDARPDLGLPPADVESLVRGPGEGSRFDRLEGDDAGAHGVLFRIMHGCLYRGTEPDRRERVAALLDSLPHHYGLTCPLPDELTDLIVDLRRYDVIIDVHTGLMFPQLRKEGRDYFDARLKRTAAQERDPELALCMLLEDRPAFDAALAAMQPNARNVMLFACSRRHFAAAAEFLLQQGNRDRAATVCMDHEDHERAGRMYEEAGDLATAAHIYRDGRCLDEALRCFRALGDEVGMARTFERQDRYEQALEIWRRHGSEHEVERVQGEMARRRAGLDEPPS